MSQTPVRPFLALFFKYNIGYIYPYNSSRDAESWELGRATAILKAEIEGQPFAPLPSPPLSQLKFGHSVTLHKSADNIKLSSEII